MSWPILSADRWLAASAVLFGWLALCGVTVWRERRRRRTELQAADRLLPRDSATPTILIAHASQTGTAEALAWQAARTLQGAGLPARIASLATLGPKDLGGVDRALFIVSTYGEGDPPDTAAPFTRRVMSEAGLALDGLNYAVLALGDRTYANFCGFGRLLDGWLSDRGARPLFARVDVDNGSATALDDWRARLTELTGVATDTGAPAVSAVSSVSAVSAIAGLSNVAPPSVATPASTPAPHRWRLINRRLLNPGSAGAPAWHLDLTPGDGAALPTWQAGDLFRIVPPADPDRPRDYSIASLPADGRVQLLVRLARRADGSSGLVSGGLTDGLAIGDELHAHIQPHPGFRLGDNAIRPLILIGNGTGIAGLRALLKARAAAARSKSPPPTWLLFGERSAAHDAFYADDLRDWQRAGVLTRCDRTWSRDPGGPRYVQHRLIESLDEVRRWVDNGAALYVCGSLEGMASGVDAALADGLGRATLDDLIIAGRYRRDVY